MDNKLKGLNIYLMGIGGTAMGSFAGLLKKSGANVFGSDSAVYSPMKEKLAEWGINYHTPYQAKNLVGLVDLVIVGNVIRKDNPEVIEVIERKIPYDSFPKAFSKLFLKDAISVVATGTHGKTTCSSLLAYSFSEALLDVGFLIGGVPLNFNESFSNCEHKQAPFVVEGDEYDTAFFDKRPKFIHYDPKYLLVTSIEFDHADIYQDLDEIVWVFADLFSTLEADRTIIINNNDNNIKKALAKSQTKANIFSYGKAGDYQAEDEILDQNGISLSVSFKGKNLGKIHCPLYGAHNLSNILGCYGLLHQFGLTHKKIATAFGSFLGVTRRLEQKLKKNDLVVIDDFAHHPTAVMETIKAAKQKYPNKKICAIFEPRSATSCKKIFEQNYQEAFMVADRVFLAPLGRELAESERLDTKLIARKLNEARVGSQAFENYQDLKAALVQMEKTYVLLFMSNGNFNGLLNCLLADQAS